ncbi:MAG: YdiU family protein [Rhodoferax sp.]|uniref:protein adenylyltransferase SelO n=1 Tax=Rhodoferax sp. TaxID=50421 RepID=UPI002634AA99|nr:YdiU family protein [Rhodoferax sp.]MDD2879136.1 YdiU family protein [Rhodoferax sp.]
MNAASEIPKIVHTKLAWHNRFHQLGRDFYTPLAPQPLGAPYWVGRSNAVADLLGLERSQLNTDDLLQALSGNLPISGTQPLASVYSGHQFGNWAGQLGDGRACLLGEANGLEVQLKGSGLTPYSRMGDGRAVLRSSIREFLCSEAMQALGIPTTRALCVTGSDDEVWRETPESSAVVTRTAPSFIRFGHFEHFSARNQLTPLKTLADYVIERYYPACLTTEALDANPYANLLQAVTERTAVMVAHWQAVGFCHGVMNTDNMSILGLTMDYGPFQFLDAFEPGHICNHTDRGGRYAFERQPEIAHWNLYALAQALMPLIKDQPLALQALATFEAIFKDKLYQLMRAKLGLVDAAGAVNEPLGTTETSANSHSNTSTAGSESHKALIQTLLADLLNLMAQDRVDYTLFWRRLSTAVATDAFDPVRDLFLQRPIFDAWMLRYLELLTLTNKGLSAGLMYKNNPKFVLRNYLGEEAIQAAKLKNFTVLADLLKVLERPFDEHPEHEPWAGFPPDWAASIAISCSS